MSEAINIALSKQVGIFNKIDVIANNVANVDTAGFRKQMIINSSKEVRNGNETVSYPGSATTIIDTSAGAVSYTNRPLDMAIMGEGYFKINSPLGPRYSRDGRFHTDGNGVLVDGNFFPVASIDGDVITITQGGEVSVNHSGQVMVDGALVGQVGIFNFANQELLQPVGGGMYKTDQQESVASSYEVIGGAYEGSNVKSVLEMQDLIETQNYSSMTNNIINIVEEMEQNAVKSLADSAKQ